MFAGLRYGCGGFMPAGANFKHLLLMWAMLLKVAFPPDTTCDIAQIISSVFSLLVVASFAKCGLVFALPHGRTTDT